MNKEATTVIATEWIWYRYHKRQKKTQSVSSQQSTAITILKICDREWNEYRYFFRTVKTIWLVSVTFCWLFIILFRSFSLSLSFFPELVDTRYWRYIRCFWICVRFHERCVERAVKKNSKDAGRITIFDPRTIILFQQ